MKYKKLVISTINDIHFDQRMQRISKTLVSKGYEIHWVCRKQHLQDHEWNDGFDYRLSCFFNNGLLFYLEWNIRLFLFFLKNRFDTYYAVDLDTLIPNTIASIFFKGRLIYDAHEYFSEVPELVDQPIKKKVWELVACFFIPMADICITVGPNLSHILGKRYHQTFHTIRNVPYYKHSPNAKRDKIILYQGAINKGRGLEQAVLAMQYIDGYKLQIIGDGKAYIKIKNLIRKHNLTNKVIMLGALLPSQLPKYTQQAAIGLNLLAPLGLSYYYSLANKTFDMIQDGLPAIHMEFPEYISLQKKYNIGWLLDELTAEKLGELINNIIDNQFELDEKSKNCYLAAKELNWENESIKLNQINI